MTTLCSNDPLRLRRESQDITPMGLTAQWEDQVSTTEIKENIELPPFLNIQKRLSGRA